MIEVYNPVTHPKVEKVVRTPFVLTDKSVGLLSNSKPNVELLYDHTATLLPHRFQIPSITRSAKANAALPAPEKILKDLSQKTEVVINAVGD